jgi:hypothetical protein
MLSTRTLREIRSILSRAIARAQAREKVKRNVVLPCEVPNRPRTEELRALTWDHADLVGNPDVNPPIPPHVQVWRSVRVGGDTKTPKSRRSLALPKRCVDALVIQHRKRAFARTVGYRTRRGQRPAGVPQGGQGRRAGCEGVDTPRAASQLRIGRRGLSCCGPTGT